MKLDEFIKFNPKESLSKGKCFKCVDMASLKPFTRKPDHFISIYKNGSKFRNGDTIMARITPCLENGKTSYINFLQQNEVAFGSTEFIVARAKTNVSLPLFIYYLLCSNRIREIAIGSMTGSSGRERVQQISLNEIEIPAYSISFQQHIVDTIGSVDDLIEKNEEIINKCEEFARAIFIEMTRKIQVFVPFGNVLSRCSTGLNPRKNFTLGHGNCFYVTIKNMSGTNVLLDSKCDKIDFDAIAKISARSHLSKGDVLFSGIGTIGRSYLCYETPTNWNISESVFCFSPNELVSSEYLYELVTSNDFISFANSNASGAAQKGIRMSDLKTHLVPLLNKSDLEKFNSKVKPILKKANICRQENDKLSRNKRNLLEKYFASN